MIANYKPIFIFLLLLVPFTGMAQKKDADNFTVVKERKPRKDIQGIVNRTREHVNGLSVGIGMHMSFLQNPAFGERIKSKEMKHDIRFATVFSSVGLRAIVMPYIIDFSAYSSVPFEYQPGVVLQDSTITHFRHQGMDFSFSMAAITLSHIIYPYLGIGYSFSRLGSGKKLVTDEQIMVNTSALFWKVGIAIHPLPWFFITAEYSASIDGIGKSTQRGFGTVDFSLRYRLTSFRKRR